jgi:anti-sigma B factor antagonist
MFCPERLNPTIIHTDMSLEIRIQRAAGTADASVITLQLAGSLNNATAPDLERQLAAALAGPIRDIVFDLARLKFISSAGVRVFSTTRKTLKERGGQASFVNVQPQIELVLDVMKSLPGVAMYQNSADLDRYLALLQSDQPKTP